MFFFKLGLRLCKAIFEMHSYTSNDKHQLERVSGTSLCALGLSSEIEEKLFALLCTANVDSYETSWIFFDRWFFLFLLCAPLAPKSPTMASLSRSPTLRKLVHGLGDQTESCRNWPKQQRLTYVDMSETGRCKWQRRCFTTNSSFRQFAGFQLIEFTMKR